MFLRRVLAVTPRAARSKVTLPDLPYDYNALEPVIAADIMRLHHSKHHAAYVAGYNEAIAKEADAIAKSDISTAISLQPALKFHGGGHLNHSIFWNNLSPINKDGGAPPTGTGLLLFDSKREEALLSKTVATVKVHSCFP
jgi:Fe-Mn family superoxide dismutase